MRDKTDAEQKEREYEDSIAHRYNRDYHEPPIMAKHSRAFADFVAAHVKPGDRVLDLGCGAASLWPLWASVLPRLDTLVGVDLSPKMLDVARGTFPAGDFREGSFLQIPSGPGEFDVVIVSSAFHHISDELLPDSLKEVHRVLDEHGLLIGREPLMSERLSDRGGWFTGALMHLRHLAYRLSGTREYPEPDPGPDHHAYHPKEFLRSIDTVLTVVDVEFRNPASLFLARVHHPALVKLALHLDDFIKHREGQEVHYAARKNFSTTADVNDCIEKALLDNKLSEEELKAFMVQVAATARVLERELQSSEAQWNR